MTERYFPFTIIFITSDERQPCTSRSGREERRPTNGTQTHTIVMHNRIDCVCCRVSPHASRSISPARIPETMLPVDLVNWYFFIVLVYQEHSTASHLIIYIIAFTLFQYQFHKTYVAKPIPKSTSSFVYYILKYFGSARTCVCVPQRRKKKKTDSLALLCFRVASLAHIYFCFGISQKLFHSKMVFSGFGSAVVKTSRIFRNPDTFDGMGERTNGKTINSSHTHK